MSKELSKRPSVHHKWKQGFGLFLLLDCLLISFFLLATVATLSYIDMTYDKRVYPRIFVGSMDMTGKTKDDIVAYWEQRNIPYRQAKIELHLENMVATISGTELGLGYDSKLIAEQAYAIGRSDNFFSDIYTKLIKQQTIISPYFRYNNDVLKNKIEELAASVDEPAKDALFQFENGRVVDFKTAHTGKRVNRDTALTQMQSIIPDIPYNNKTVFPITLSIEPLPPQVTTAKANTFGIKEKIGEGYSQFHGSIPGRIHNVALGASRFNGVLIPPGGIISYNEIVGDISAATGFQPAYIIKDGRTVLGDGGGVCQVSSTLFRAAMNAGLPILERTAHAYRVHYYEDGGFLPGLDATVFAPSVDLKIKNDTPAHILIQSKIDTQNMSLTIDFYGTSDGRKGEILNHVVSGIIPPPPPLYQDDPTLAKGVVKQVDWDAYGTKAVFEYKVTRGSDILTDQQFVSNYRPWQAVYLRGTM